MFSFELVEWAPGSEWKAGASRSMWRFAAFGTEYDADQVKMWSDHHYDNQLFQLKATLPSHVAEEAEFSVPDDERQRVR